MSLTPSTKKRKLQEDDTTSSDDPTTKETSTSSSSSSSLEEPPPLYGTQEYWEQRYKNNDRLLVKHKEWNECPANHNDDDDNNSKNNVEQNHEDEGLAEDSTAALPMHEWYFTYNDLKPLLFPLLLGDNDDNAEDEDDDDDDKVKGQPSKQNDEEEKDDNHTHANTTNNDNDQDSIEFEEEEEDEEQPHRPGLVQQGVPLSILEVGCGDAPLGTDLAKDLVQLEKDNPQVRIQEVICCDYSASAIDILKKHASTSSTTTKGDTTTTNNTPNNNIVNFVVADARHMEYSQDQFHLILEKGTLDAMLSDKQDGIQNCIQIVQECARVLAIGGYIVIISHLNANTEAGLAWLDDVVVPGLRAGGNGKGYSWEIEVHGNNDIPDGEMEEDEDHQEGCDATAAANNDNDDDPDQGDCEEMDDEGGQSSGEGPGPAVYVIHKKPDPALKKTKDHETDTPSDNNHDDEVPTIPLKFFSY